MALLKIANNMFVQCPRECTLDEWRKWYLKNRGERFLVRDTFSRVRAHSGDHVNSVQRGAWGKSNIFSRCHNCGGLSIYGVCQRCGFVVVCCQCRRVLQPGGSYRKMGVGSDNISHGYCLECVENDYPEQYKKIMARRRGNHGNN